MNHMRLKKKTILKLGKFHWDTVLIPIHIIINKFQYSFNVLTINIFNRNVASTERRAIVLKIQFLDDCQLKSKHIAIVLSKSRIRHRTSRAFKLRVQNLNSMVMRSANFHDTSHCNKLSTKCSHQLLSVLRENYLKNYFYSRSKMDFIKSAPLILIKKNICNWLTNRQLSKLHGWLDWTAKIWNEFAN